MYNIATTNNGDPAYIFGQVLAWGLLIAIIAVIFINVRKHK